MMKFLFVLPNDVRRLHGGPSNTSGPVAGGARMPGVALGLVHVAHGTRHNVKMTDS